MGADDKRQQIADTFIQMISKTSLESIRVQDIAEQAGISKATFYRLFCDKYDVMNWIYVGSVDPLVKSAPDLSHWKEWSIQNQTHILANKQYFKRIIKYHGQNSFESCLIAYYQNNIRMSIKVQLGKTQIPPDLDFAIRAISRVNAFAFVNWINGNCEQPIEEMLRQVELCIPDILKPYYGMK